MDVLKGNPYFDAGFGLALMGVGLGLLRQASRYSLVLARRHLLVSMEVTNKDPAYPWVLQWINSPQRFMAQHLTATTSVQTSATGDVQTLFSFSPSPGRHIITYKRRWIAVERKREQSMVNVNTGQPFESVMFTTVGTDRRIYEDLLIEAQRAALQETEDRTVIYKSFTFKWQQFGHPKRRRPLESVILDEGVADEIIDDLQDFKASYQWYVDRGIPYRRCYMLHGTPGSGKTSFITALAGHLGYNICILSLSDPSLTDDQLAQCLSVVPQQSIVVMEDIDAVFVDRAAKPDGFKPGLSFSGLLNVLDGVVAGEERILFLTTNHIDRLDSAIIRPGRVDVTKFLGPATRFQIEKMFLKFFPSDSSLVSQFAENVSGTGASMAELQGYFMIHKHNAQSAVDDAKFFARAMASKHKTDSIHSLNPEMINSLNSKSKDVINPESK
uniref:Mitochondrial chaperone BCS1 n=2 Tax=Hirondellea gigas TaxID=1518452 RepID=A0A6A7G986_9CRUS